jgi:hypothetical protein
MYLRELVLVLVAVCLAPACGPGEDTSCMDAVLHSDLPWLQDNVFDQSCVFASCHQGSATQAGNLNLEEGMIEENVIGVESHLLPAMNIVEPGSPDDSYLMVILGQFGRDDPRIDPLVGTMPDGGSILCQEKRDAIARWIESL